MLDVKDLQRGFLIREGYIFTGLLNSDVYNAIVIRNPDDADCDTPRLRKSTRSLKEHVKYINEMQIEEAIVIAEDIRFLLQCPSLKHLRIIPSNRCENGFDFSPLYEMPEIRTLGCETLYCEYSKQIGIIDYSKIKGLLDLSLCLTKGDINYNKISGLKTLHVSNFKGKDRDLSDLFISHELCSLSLYQCAIYSLKGITNSDKIESLDLSYNRVLKNINDLCYVSKNLKVLSIDKCTKIQDFSVLSTLENLEYLELMGSNNIPDLGFLKNLKKLKVFNFSMNILDGNITPCLNLPYVHCQQNRKHYNLLDKDLPKKLI